MTTTLLVLNLLATILVLALVVVRVNSREEADIEMIELVQHLREDVQFALARTNPKQIGDQLHALREDVSGKVKGVACVFGRIEKEIEGIRDDVQKDKQERDVLLHQLADVVEKKLEVTPATTSFVWTPEKPKKQTKKRRRVDQSGRSRGP